VLTDTRYADSRALHEPLVEKLASESPREAFEWLVGILDAQQPALRSGNATLVAYTGYEDGVSWLERTVASPVTSNWGVAAALLGVPWPRIAGWIAAGGVRRLMGLDSLYAYRAPAPNMSALHQIAAPVLPDQPTRAQLDAVLLPLVANAATPRIEQIVDAIRRNVESILSGRKREVPVCDLPKLYVCPESFPGSRDILAAHDAISDGIRQSISSLVIDEKTKH